MRPAIIPDEFCSRCGRPLWAVPMDVGFVERICMVCDNGGEEAEE